MPRIVPVVLCGGSGTRLWPRSRAERPKPFIPLLGERTLYQATLDRCANRTVFSAPIVVVGKKHLQFAKPQAHDIAADAQFIVEPIGRNTAPAIALAALAMDPQDVMLVCPSDHHIIDKAAFVDAAKLAAALASDDWLVSFGIEATAPETGYGYIRRGEALGSGFRVHSFVEKPNLETALTFLEDGNYAWNGGIFAFRAGHFIDELATYRPQLLAQTVKSFDAGIRKDTSFEPDESLFADVPGESVDYAVMENTDRAAMVDAQIGWSDIGNWDALYQKRKADTEGNVIVGGGEIIDASGTMIDTDGPHVTVIGVEDVIVIIDGDDVLVTARSAVQSVGQARRVKAL
ncbi:NTP transferase domain-containing protein [Qipengyuania sp. 6B39]|uniref:mannose-1-phosphate guanylyltransferase n=1 Tax=Qipengyuania proteolytica TaxID=2867239 RepID=UPI001C8A5A1D|nr:sugar phosphate nucleotidyltransferase [Qipengyuania proteolytica]MBX7496401.1 NTP transferase domain-containing protein [Qipengyuania proteolytica]